MTDKPKEKIPPIKPRMSLPCRLGFSALFFGSAVYFAVQGDPILASALAIVGISSFAGYRIGAAHTLASIVAIGVAIALAPSLGVAHESRFQGWFGTTGLSNRILSVGTIGVLISFVVTMILFIVVGLFLANRPRADTANRWLGFGIGAIEGAVIVLLLLGGLLMLEPAERARADTRDPLDLRGQFVSKWVLGISDNLHKSRLEPIVEKYNPFTRIPKLNKIQEVQQSVQVLSDPKKIDELIKHPSIQRLSEKPEMKEAMRKLSQDSEIQSILKSGEPMNRAAALALLRHPLVLELIDQPGFLEEAYKVIQETGVTRSDVNLED